MPAVVKTVLYLAVIVGLGIVFLSPGTLGRPGAPPGSPTGIVQLAGATITLAGAGSALVGAALLCQSLSLLLFAGIFMLGIHAFVVLYEEPALRRMFGSEYVAYCATVDRWLPHRPDMHAT